MRKRPKMRASFIQTLVYYDEPLLALLQNRKGTYILAYAMDENATDLKDPYLAKPVSKPLLDAYIQQKADLNFVMRDKRTGEPYIFDWAEFDNEALLYPAEQITDDYTQFYPEPGFFSRNHTEPFLNRSIASLVKHAYRIDGRWSAADFSRFYAKLADLYAIFSYLGELRRDKSIVSNGLSSTVSRYPWQGGGSYLGFFREVAAESREDYPLQVSRIQYASPGQIEVKGVQDSLTQIDNLITHFGSVKADLSHTYRELRSILERDGALGSDALTFSNGAITAMALSRADTILEEMRAFDVEIIRDACSDKPVPYAKLAMAIYRRGLDLHRFHAEGRVQLPEGPSTH